MEKSNIAKNVLAVAKERQEQELAFIEKEVIALMEKTFKEYEEKWLVFSESNSVSIKDTELEKVNEDNLKSVCSKLGFKYHHSSDYCICIKLDPERKIFSVASKMLKPISGRIAKRADEFTQEAYQEFITKVQNSDFKSTYDYEKKRYDIEVTLSIKFTFPVFIDKFTAVLEKEGFENIRIYQNYNIVDFSVI